MQTLEQLCVSLKRYLPNHVEPMVPSSTRAPVFVETTTCGNDHDDDDDDTAMMPVLSALFESPGVHAHTANPNSGTCSQTATAQALVPSSN